MNEPASDAEDLRSALQTISLRARTTNLTRVERLRELLDDLAALAGVGQVGAETEGVRQDARDVAHQLAGSAGTFGYDTASALAFRLEAMFEVELDDNHLGVARGLVEEISVNLNGAG